MSKHLTDNDMFDENRLVSEFLLSKTKEHVVDYECALNILKQMKEKQDSINLKNTVKQVQHQTQHIVFDSKTTKKSNAIKRRRLIIQILHFISSVMLLISVTVLGFIVFSQPYNWMIGSVCLIFTLVYGYKNFKNIILKN